MSNDRNDRLYELLPGIYQKEDALVGQQLRGLLRVINEQVNVVEDDISNLYENWFIETCDDWVVPYLAALLGYRPVREGGQSGSPATAEGLARNRILIPRREVANTIRFRRRRGTLSVLELLAQSVAGWPARAVEFYKLLGLCQNISYLRLQRGRTVDLRDGDALDLLSGPFDAIAHNVDVRRINAARRQGRYNIPSVGLFVWRLKEYSITKAPAYFLEGRHRNRDRNRFTFSALANDITLYTLPVREPEPTHIADEMNVPTPIRRRAFEQRTDDYYGLGKSVTVWVGDLNNPVPPHLIIPADLSDWAYNPDGDEIAIDPQLGRIALANERDKVSLWVSYRYAFGADIGGGEYRRSLRPALGRKVYHVSQQNVTAPDFETINEALDAWMSERTDHPAAIIEIDDSGAYSEQIRELKLNPGERLEIRARNGARPVLRLFDIRTSGGDAFVISGPDDADEQKLNPQFTMDGILIAGRGLQFRGQLSRVTIRHCTLVPGWMLEPNSQRKNEMASSLELINTTARLTIDHSIVGSIFVDQDQVMTDPLPLKISDSILDATGLDYEALGVSGPGRAVTHVRLSVVRSTVFGEVNTQAIELAENSIFMSRVRVERRQVGCMRFCYVPQESRTPPRYHCQPDGVIAAPGNKEAAVLADMRVRPRFNSMRYGTPTYCQLSNDCAEEIERGADDESEMGVFHDLFQPQRIANLQQRLEEFTPAGFDAGIILAN